MRYRLLVSLLVGVSLAQCGPGLRPLRFTNGGGGASDIGDEGEDPALVNPPTVTSVTPSFGTARGGTTLVLTGSNFSQNTTVEVGGTSCGSVSARSSTELTCVTPAHRLGLSNITVKNPASETVTMPDAFTFRGFLYVVDGGLGSLTGFEITPSTGDLTEVTGSPFTTGTGASDVVIHPALPFVYVLNSGTDNISAYSADSEGSLTEISGSPFSSIASGNASRMAISGSGRTLYSTEPGTGTFSSLVIDQETGALSSRTSRSVSSGVQAASVLAGDAFAIVLEIDIDLVFRVGLDPVTGAPISEPQQIATCPTPANLIVNPAKTMAYVPCTSGNGTSAYRIAASGELSEVASSPFSSSGASLGAVFHPLGQFLFAGQDGTIAVYDIPESGETLTEIAGSPFANQGAGNPADYAIDPGGEFIFAANDATGSVQRFRISAGALAPLGATPSNGAPIGIVFF